MSKSKIQCFISGKSRPDTPEERYNAVTKILKADDIFNSYLN